MDTLKGALKELLENANYIEIKKDLASFVKNNDKYIDVLNKEIILATLPLIDSI